VLQARRRIVCAEGIGSVGKQARDESGKYPVNEDDEEISRREYGNHSSRGVSDVGRATSLDVWNRTIHVIASAAKQSIFRAR
jgi:hypothetical protein